MPQEIGLAQEMAKILEDYYAKENNPNRYPPTITPCFGSNTFICGMPYGDIYEVTVTPRQNVLKTMELTTRCLTRTTIAMLHGGHFPFTVWKGDRTDGVPTALMMQCQRPKEGKLPQDLEKCMAYAISKGCDHISFDQDQRFINDEELAKFGIILRD